MSSDTVLNVDSISKVYQQYRHPRDRLKQLMVPRLRDALGLPPKIYFKEFTALHETSFTISKGESVGIVGRNGSGKSTLLQLIAGTLSPTTGEVEVNGRLSALLELGTSFNPEFNGRENIELSLTLQGFSRSQARDKFNDVAAFADIGEFMNQPVRTYSSGMYARLAFAVAINAEPELLIVDEILAVGDVPFQQKCLNRMYQMLDEGVSMILVSHDVYQVRSICQSALLLEKGRPILFDRSDKVMDEYVARFDATPAVKSDLRSVGYTSTMQEPSAPTSKNGAEFMINIQNPQISSGGSHSVTELKSLDPVELSFEYRIHGNYRGALSFVVNLYREDDVYIFGTTTKMRQHGPFKAEPAGRVTIRFPELPLVSGKYKFRVAVNDERGMNILVEAYPICQITIEDDFRAVGIVDLKHEWQHEALDLNEPRNGQT